MSASLPPEMTDRILYEGKKETVKTLEIWPLSGVRTNKEENGGKKGKDINKLLDRVNAIERISVPNFNSTIIRA